VRSARPTSLRVRAGPSFTTGCTASCRATGGPWRGERHEPAPSLHSLCGWWPSSAAQAGRWIDMPVIYRVIVDGDVGSPRHFPEGAAGAVWCDDEEEGRLCMSYLAVRGDGRWIPIRHPVEEHDLRALGKTFSSATMKGELWLLDPHLCTHCGRVFYIPIIRPYMPLGCSIPLVMGIAVGVLSWLMAMVAISRVVSVGPVAMFGVGLTMAVLCAALALIAMVVIALMMYALARWIARVRFGEMLRAHTPAGCEDCGSPIHVAVSSLSEKSMTLGNGKTVHVSRAGIS
jgi:hypothetical protein